MGILTHQGELLMLHAKFGM